ncbi:TetR family transcriptional regulator [Streptomyces sp. LP11]|uniref:TetR family transcriptional regulator n=1 Tax=Streptomyces pyxinicus TaxID=2970331 RepID=A0ABT2AUJ9_9ACTN|nr:TetR/AcrR family transcriptional regulator [Streptomyces sp. LP11]MCS0599921.1 TetR family transcriptional regulator [Streptomyces sp. LP11]
MTSVEEPPPPAGRARDAARTRAEILDAATREFARAGYDGARVDEIAARTHTTKRMIYYYFGGKEQLFTAVLERAYTASREAERHLDVDHQDPVAAIRRLAELTFDHHERHPEFVRLVSIENIHGAEHLEASDKLGTIGSPVLDTLRRVLAAGQEAGRFRGDVDAVDLHVMIGSYCFFRVAGRHTFDALFGRDLVDPAQRDHYRRMLGDMVVAYLTADLDAD